MMNIKKLIKKHKPIKLIRLNDLPKQGGAAIQRTAYPNGIVEIHKPHTHIWTPQQK